MPSHIIKSIGRWGVKTEPASSRVCTPRPGDVVDFGENEGTYPFLRRYGRIDSLSCFETGKAHVCCELGSAFLHENGKVSISGGPFALIPLDDLIPTFGTKRVTFWNWGDNYPGGHQGVDYGIDRPVFLLKKQEKEA